MITKVMYGGNGAINLILAVSVIVLFVEKRSDVELAGVKKSWATSLAQD